MEGSDPSASVGFSTSHPQYRDRIMRAQYHARLETAGQSLTYACTCTHVAPAPRTPDPIPTPLGGRARGSVVCIDMEGQIGQKEPPVGGFVRLYAILVVYSVPFPVAGKRRGMFTQYQVLMG